MKTFKKIVKLILTTNYCWSFIFASIVGEVAGYYVFKDASNWCWWVTGAIGVIGMVGVGLKVILEEAVSCGILRIEEDDGA